MAPLPYGLIDADNHYYETPDCFTRHIEAKHRERTMVATRREGGDGDYDITVNGVPWTYSDVKFEKTNKPGSLVEILHAKGNVKWADSYNRENMLPAYQDRDARLKLMDEQGIEAALVLPSVGVVIEEPLIGDPELTYASLRAFNRWIEDEWGYAYRERIFSVPMLSLLDLDQALVELDRVLAAGARIVHLRPGPVAGRSPADDCYDPFWARLNEAEVPVAMHLSESGYNRMMAVNWGEDPNNPVREQSAFQWAFSHGDRPIMETIGSLIYNNLFTRFPKLKVLSIENGAGWVEYLLTTLDKKKGMAGYGPWPFGRPKGRPSDIFRRHVYVTPYPEDDVERVVDFLGADNVLFGSDFPHPEGMADPARFVDLLGSSTDEAATRKVMRDNSAALLKLA